MKLNIKNWVLFSIVFTPALCQATSPSYYSASDFARIKKVDTHVHINSSSPAMVDTAKELGFQLVTINVDYPDFPPVAEQYQIALNEKNRAPDTVAFAGTFLMETWGEPQWQQTTIEQIVQVRKSGAVAIKVWKNIGMSERNKDGALIMIDDPSLVPVFNFMAKEDIPLIGHQAEPRNCWLPVSEMTVLNDKVYFANHPEYHMYKHPDMPDYEEHMKRRDDMLATHPSLEFVGAHMASLEWSVDRLAAFLDRFPHAKVDLAARIGQLQYQSKQDYQKVRQFFIKYSERLLYATDLTQMQSQTEEVTKTEMINVWRSDWQYLALGETMSSAFVEGSFKGLHLPKNVIDNLYYNNAIKQFPSLADPM